MVSRSILCRYSRHLLVILLVAEGIYVFPLLQRFLGWAVRFCLHSQEDSLWALGGGIQPYIRTLAFAFTTAFLQVFLGFFGALIFKRISGDRPFGVLLFPALLGTTSIAFVFKRIPSLATFLAQRPSLITWATLLTIETWQYSPLCLYLFWLRLRGVPQSLRDFSSSARLTWLEDTKHVAWPYCRNLAAVLALFAFLQGTAEFSKTSIILRASVGTRTQFVSHWLESGHRQLANSSPKDAKRLSLAYSGILLVLTLIAAVGTVVVVAVCLSLSLAIATVLKRLKHHYRPPRTMVQARSTASSRKLERVSDTFLRVLATTVLVVPPLWELARDLGTQTTHEVYENAVTAIGLLFDSMPFLLLATCFLALVTIVFGIVVRLAYPKRAERFGIRSLPLFSSVLMLRAVPAVGLSYCALYWLGFFPEHFRTAMPVFWVISQSIVGFSLVGAFILYVHFEVSPNEVTFYQMSGASCWEVAWYGFIKRFWLSYLLLIIFCITLIYNEDTISVILSDYVRSVTPELHKKAMGQTANYSYGAVLAVPSLLGSTCLICIWSYLLRRDSQKVAP